jgi:hypothetical protein
MDNRLTLEGRDLLDHHERGDDVECDENMLLVMKGLAILEAQEAAERLEEDDLA